MRPLRNPLHEAFCQYYVFGHPDDSGPAASWREKPRGNATRSYEACYEARGNVATSASGRLLRRRDVQARIDELEELRRRLDGDG